MPQEMPTEDMTDASGMPRGMGALGNV
jgi:hypothetical protein